MSWCKRSGRETLAFGVLLIGLLIATGRLATGCQSPVAPTPAQVEAGAIVATGLCTLIEGIEDNGVVRTICASVEEVATIVEFILTLRASRDSGSFAAIGDCRPLPSSTLCATSSERAKAILFVSKVRASRLMLDGGAR